MSTRLRLQERILGESPAIDEVRKRVTDVAPFDVAVVLRGESGTGKDLVASTIHQESDRRGHTYYPVNMGALSSELVCSQLFGHERGAFTGATARRRGIFELAHNGTLFLDEIGTLHVDLQANLLRVLETQRFQRVGGGSLIHSDVRLLTATNCDLGDAVAKGTFREDLYHRLNVFEISLPPLRDRGDDAVLLARRFLALYAEEFDRPAQGFSAAVEEAFLVYSWPGNVRELENLVLRMVITAGGAQVQECDLPAELRR